MCVRGMSDRRRDSEEAEYRKTLGVVGDLRRPEHACRHGDEIRLQDRPGYDIPGGKRLSGAHALDRIGHVRRSPAALRVDQEERKPLRQRRRDRFAGALQPGHGLAERGLDRVGLFGGHQEELDRGGPHRRVEGVEDEERIGVHEIEERLDEGLAVGRSRSAARGELREDPVGVGVGVLGIVFERVDDLADALRDAQASDGLAVLPIRAFQDELLGPFVGRTRGARDLLQVVVVGQRPEDGDRRHAAPRQLPRDADRVEGLDEGEEPGP